MFRSIALTLVIASTFTLSADAQIFGLGGVGGTSTSSPTRGRSIRAPFVTPLPRTRTAPRTRRAPTRGRVFGLPTRPATRTPQRTTQRPRTRRNGTLEIGTTYRRSQYDRRFAARLRTLQSQGRRLTAANRNLAAAIRRTTDPRRRAALLRTYHQRAAQARRLADDYRRLRSRNTGTSVMYTEDALHHERQIVNGLRRSAQNRRGSLRVDNGPNGRPRVLRRLPSSHARRDVSTRFRSPAQRRYDSLRNQIRRSSRWSR